MGHERVGLLPRTKRWRAIVSAINHLSEKDSDAIARLADKTLENVSSRFSKLHKDRGVQAAFAYLIALATSHLPHSGGLASVDTALHENPSPARIVKNLSVWVNRHATSREYAEVACRAGADTIVEWTREQSKQHLLFDDSASVISIWAASSNARGFCQVARSFFAHFTERYLRYFLEREASAEFQSLESRQRFDQNLHSHIEDVSQHAFETSKITQSFAAGWFNNHVRETRPSDKAIEGFLSIAFGKMQEELQRETTK
jgi:hypothetical protein